MPKSMTLRLTDEQAAELEAIARVENVPIAEEVRIALAEHIANRRRDRAFQTRLKASMKRNQEILDRLASTQSLAQQYLDLADYLLIAEAVTGLKAEVLAEMPRVVSLASSSLSVPASGWQGQQAYPEPAQKAGLLAARLAKNHPLPDGNKRAAQLAMIEFLERNGYQLEQPEPSDAVDAMLRVASSEMAVGDFVEWLRSRLKKRNQLRLAGLHGSPRDSSR